MAPESVGFEGDDVAIHDGEHHPSGWKPGRDLDRKMNHLPPRNWRLDRVCLESHAGLSIDPGRRASRLGAFLLFCGWPARTGLGLLLSGSERGGELEGEEFWTCSPEGLYDL